MKSLGIAGYFPVQIHKILSVAESMNNHLNPNVLYRVLPPGVLCLPSFFYQFATSFLSAVRWGRQALWLVLVVCWLFFERPANVLDYKALAISTLIILCLFLLYIPICLYDIYLQSLSSRKYCNMKKLFYLSF